MKRELYLTGSCLLLQRSTASVSVVVILLLVVVVVVVVAIVFITVAFSVVMTFRISFITAKTIKRSTCMAVGRSFDCYLSRDVVVLQSLVVV